MFVSEDSKVYLEVPEAMIVTGLSRSQIYSISGNEIPSRKDPRNNSRTLFEADDIFLARKELDERGKVGDKNFRKWEEVDFDGNPVARSAINKMYRNKYDLEDLNLLHLVNNKWKVGIMDKDSQEFQEKFPHVKDQCFGWADENSEECTEHCELFELCKQERDRETLQQLASKFRKEDSEDEILEELEKNAEETADMMEEAQSELESLDANL